MYYFVILVVHDVEKFEEVIQAWRDAGVTGATILPSLGVASMDNERALREDLPLMPLISNLFAEDEVLNRTLFSIVEGKELVDRVVKSTQDILGDLNSPNNGVLAVLPVEQAFGLHRKTK
jgi:nitrogen regulatory protein PII